MNPATNGPLDGEVVIRCPCCGTRARVGVPFITWDRTAPMDDAAFDHKLASMTLDDVRQRMLARMRHMERRDIAAALDVSERSVYRWLKGAPNKFFRPTAKKKKRARR